MKRFLWHAAWTVALLGIGALAFVTAGFAPIAADAGHWPVTRVLLHFAMERAVATRSLPLEAPALDQRWLLRKGAGHYANGCVPCHGAPGEPRSLVARRMTPQPPLLRRTLADGEMSREELFWIVKHGIKYTAMPSWPTQDRDDEVWAMVAFLERMPDLTASAYRGLAFGGLDAGPGDCAGCHGESGEGNAAYPRIAGLDAAYLEATLQAFASGRRQSGMMQPVAAALEEGQVQRVARPFSDAPVAAPRRRTDIPAGVDEAAVARGRRLALEGDGSRRIPACVGCHGPDRQDRNRMYPEITGQHPAYLALQLELFARGGRGGTVYAPLMERAAAALEPGEISDLAAYYGSLPPGS
jgi:cytochrome c553